MGWIVGIAPEGTRSKTRQLLEGKPGAALLAIRNQVQVIPAAVLGTTEVMQSILRLKKAQVEVRFGKPFMLPQASDEGTDKTRLQQATDEIMCRIACCSRRPPRFMPTIHTCWNCRLNKTNFNYLKSSQRENCNDPNSR